MRRKLTLQLKVCDLIFLHLTQIKDKSRFFVLYLTHCEQVVIPQYVLWHYKGFLS